MTRWLLTAALVVAGGLGVAGGARAQQQQRPAGGDEQIVMELHRANLDEIQMGQMAAERGVSARAKGFGAHLVRDHRAADERVLALARDMKVDPARLAAPYDAAAHGALMHPDLTQARGADFDRLFAADMVADHQATIDRARAAQSITRDARLKTLIGQLLPTLQAHLAEARALAPASTNPPPATTATQPAQRMPPVPE